MLTWDHLWNPESINDELEVSVIPPRNNEVYNNICDYLRQINADERHLYHNYSDTDVDGMVMWINNQG